MPAKQVFETFPQIETKNLRLRRIQASDAAALYAILSDAEVVEYYDDDAFTAIEQASDQIDSWEIGYQHRRAIRWAITEKKAGALIGTCGYYGIHTWHRRASIGYELARDYWRQGIMTEALGAIVVLALFVERALALLFEHRWFIKNFDQKGVKEPVAFLVAIAVTVFLKFDALSIVILQERVTVPGMVLTAAVVAGGGKGAVKLFRDVLKWKSSAYQEQYPERNRNADSGGSGQ